MVSNILTAIAYIILTLFILHIGRLCWLDTRNDFHRIYRETRYLIHKKKRAD